jgi:glycosyltransferase involved in cell wall biosynthesis
MHCLNEAETVGTCIDKALGFLKRTGVHGEVLVADNGSVDGSRSIVEAKGARVLQVSERGYGAALRGGIAAARGRFIIMGDADDSYDFAELDAFLGELRRGADLVMGNRFKGGVKAGAMPPLHRWLGNPLLSFLGRLLFKIKVHDFHCGLRGFNAHHRGWICAHGHGVCERIMVRGAEGLVSGQRSRQTLAYTHLHLEGRWRHLKFLLVYSPRWLFLYPGVVFLSLGLAVAVFLFPGPFWLGGVGFENKTFIAGCLCLLVGVQSITFSLLVRRYASRQGYLPRHRRYANFLDHVTLERLALVALVLFAAGCGGVAWCFTKWWGAFFGAFESPMATRLMVLSITLLAAATQIFLTAFLGAVMDVGKDPVSRERGHGLMSP